MGLERKPGIWKLLANPRRSGGLGWQDRNNHYGVLFCTQVDGPINIRRFPALFTTPTILALAIPFSVRFSRSRWCRLSNLAQPCPAVYGGYKLRGTQCTSCLPLNRASLGFSAISRLRPRRPLLQINRHSVTATTFIPSRPPISSPEPPQLSPRYCRHSLLQLPSAPELHVNWGPGPSHLPCHIQQSSPEKDLRRVRRPCQRFCILFGQTWLQASWHSRHQHPCLLGSFVWYWRSWRSQCRQVLACVSRLRVL